MHVPSPGERPLEGSQASDPVGALVFACLDHLERGEEQRVEALLASAGEHAAAVRSRLEALRAFGLVAQSAGVAPPDAPERIGDFRLIRRLGRGGMGVVYEAEQVSLGRRVALKLVRPEELCFSDARERFRREVAAVARMQHVGIVPVFAVGEEKGMPYFAMELVDGCTLADVIADFAGRSSAGLTGRDLQRTLEARSSGSTDSTRHAAIFEESWIDAGVRLAREIAEALDHAHGRGIVHRDVKPSNVMLSRAGRAMLFDFGLAHGPDDARMTRSGALPGSLPYMSPEQLRSERELDGRTDVWSLGVTLWELLALRQAFAGQDWLRLQQRIQSGDLPRLDRLIRGFPSDVALVVATALETDRARRYATAEDFARDLGHLLARRPIEARRPGLVLRGLRWAQRHPRGSAGIAAASALLVVGAGVFGWRERVLGGQVAEKGRLAEARASELYDIAAEFLFDFHDAIEDLPGAVRGRELVLARAEELLARLSREDAADPRVQATLAQAHLRFGSVLGGLGRANRGEPERACAEFLAAEQAYRELLVREPEALEWLHGLHGALTSRASIELYLERIDVTRATLGSGAEVLVEIERRAPEDPRTLRAQAFDRSVRANLAMQTGDFEEAARVRAQLLAVCDGALARSPEDLELLRLRLLSLAHLAEAHGNQRRYVEAQALYARGVAEAERLLERRPESQEIQVLLAANLSGAGSSLAALSDVTQALELLRRAQAILDRLLAADPENQSLIVDALHVYGDLTEALGRNGEREECLVTARRRVELAERVNSQSTAVQSVLQLAQAWSDLAGAEDEVGDLEASVRSGLRSAEVAESGLNQGADVPLLVVALEARRLAASNLVDLTRAGEARAQIELAVGLLDERRGELSRSGLILELDGQQWMTRACVQEAAGELEEAERSYAAAVELFEQRFPDGAPAFDAEEPFAFARLKRGYHLELQGRATQAESEYGLVAERLARTLQAGQRNGLLPSYHLVAWDAWSRMALERGDRDAALERGRRVLAALESMGEADPEGAAELRARVEALEQDAAALER